GFMVGSVCSQATGLATRGTTSAAYEYTPGRNWDEYNCEQQASIVEDWYGRGLDQFDRLYPYICDNILLGRTTSDPAPMNATAAMQVDGPTVLRKGQSATYRARPIGLPAGGRHEWWPAVGNEMGGLRAVQMSYGELMVRAEENSGKGVVMVRYSFP